MIIIDNFLDSTSIRELLNRPEFDNLPLGAVVMIKQEPSKTASQSEGIEITGSAPDEKAGQDYSAGKLRQSGYGTVPKKFKRRKAPRWRANKKLRKIKTNKCPKL